MTLAQGLRVADAYQRSLLALRARAKAGATAAWANVPGLDTQTASRWLDQILPLTTTVQTQAITLTDAYVATYASTVDGGPYLAAGVTPADVTYRAGSPIADVYTRPIITARAAIANGATYQAARDQGLARAIQTIVTDLALAARSAANLAMARHPRIVGYRRQPDPGACPFCLLASTQRYHIGDLLPIHPGCGCTVAPIVGTHDPGQIINPDRLAALRDQTAAIVRHHGELGPVLVPEGIQFTGPDLEAVA